MIGLVLAAVLAADGGTDVPYADLEAGVHQVMSAQQADGGELGPGWHLTPARMIKVGEVITEADRIRNAPPSQPLGFWAGAAIGGVLGAATMILLFRVVNP